MQIAVRDYGFPAARNTAVTPQLNARVADKLRAIWGPYAGWCQQVLFFADLKTSSPRNSLSPRKRSVKLEAEKMKGEDGKEEDGAEVARKLTFEEEVEALIKTPGAKRRRGSSIAGVKAEEVQEEMKAEVKKENRSPGMEERAGAKMEEGPESPLAKRVKAET